MIVRGVSPFVFRYSINAFVFMEFYFFIAWDISKLLWLVCINSGIGRSVGEYRSLVEKAWMLRDR